MIESQILLYLFFQVNFVAFFVCQEECSIVENFESRFVMLNMETLERKPMFTGGCNLVTTSLRKLPFFNFLTLFNEA